MSGFAVRNSARLPKVGSPAQLSSRCDLVTEGRPCRDCLFRGYLASALRIKIPRKFLRTYRANRRFCARIRSFRGQYYTSLRRIPSPGFARFLIGHAKRRPYDFKTPFNQTLSALERSPPHCLVRLGAMWEESFPIIDSTGKPRGPKHRRCVGRKDPSRPLYKCYETDQKLRQGNPSPRLCLKHEKRCRKAPLFPTKASPLKSLELARKMLAKRSLRTAAQDYIRRVQEGRNPAQF